MVLEEILYYVDKNRKFRSPSASELTIWDTVLSLGVVLFVFDADDRKEFMICNT